MICLSNRSFGHVLFVATRKISLVLLLLLFCSAPYAFSAENKIYVDKDGEKTYVDPEMTLPTLEEINAKVKWKKGEVKNATKHFEEFLAKQERPVSFADALKLKNDSDENNNKIRNAMRWLPGKQDKQNFDAVLNRRMKGDVTSTNPLMAQTIEDMDLYQCIGVGLIGFDWDMKPFADSDMVSNWERSDDSMYEKFTLRDDLTWSDGTPITAHDLEFSFQLIMRPEIPIPAIRSGVDELKYIKAYGDHTFVVFHKNPLSTNVWNMDFPFIPKHKYEKTWRADKTLKTSAEHQELLDHPVVAGPYEIISRKFNQEIILKRRESYYTYKGKQVRDIPSFKEVRFRVFNDPNTSLLALKRGDIEEMELEMPQWQNQTGSNDYYEANTKVRSPEWTYYYLGWNLKDPKDKDQKTPHPIFSDLKVRQAMQYAFPHEEFLKVQNYGLLDPGLGLYHPTSWMYPKSLNLQPYKQDIDKALDLLEAAGWEDTDNDGTLDKEIDGKKVQFDFTILCLAQPFRIDACSLLKNALAKMGIKCTIQPLELTTIVARMNAHNFDACFGGWGTGANPDTGSNIWTTDAIKGGRNYMSYSNRQVDGLFELGKQIAESKEKREEIVKEYELGKVGITATSDDKAIYGKIHELIYNDAVSTVICYKSSFYGFSKSLRGYSFSPRGPYHFSPGVSSIWKDQ